MVEKVTGFLRGIDSFLLDKVFGNLIFYIQRKTGKDKVDLIIMALYFMGLVGLISVAYSEYSAMEPSTYPIILMFLLICFIACLESLGKNSLKESYKKMVEDRIQGAGSNKVEKDFIKLDETVKYSEFRLFILMIIIPTTLFFLLFGILKLHGTFWGMMVLLFTYILDSPYFNFLEKEKQ